MMLGSITSLLAQSKIIQSLKDSNQVRQSLHFNSSTLRMLNLQRDTAIDNLVRGVDKLSIYIMDGRTYTTDDFFDTAEQLQEAEQFEEYLVMDGDAYNLQVVGKPRKQEIIGLVNADAGNYIFKLDGTIDLLQLPQVWQQISNPDTSKVNIFSFLKDRVIDTEADLKRREARRKQWEERRERERVKADSIEIAKNTTNSPENE
ncbi:MAG: hypothetical protein AAGJ18_05310 [Bacteroidota bacterium]